MRILHIVFGLPPYANGGLPLYVEGLVSAQEALGDEPMVLEPGAMNGKPGVRKLKMARHKVFRVMPALPVAYNFGVNEPMAYMKPIKKEIYRRFLEKVKPEVVHVHSLMGIHKEFFEVVKEMGIKIVMTTHDYYGLDLRANFVDVEGRVYEDREPRKVAERNYGLGVSTKKQAIVQTGIYKKIKNAMVLKKIRGAQRKKVAKESLQIEIPDEIVLGYKRLLKYYDEIFEKIDYFLYNSTITEDIYRKFVNGRGEILPLMLPGLRKIKHTKEKGTILKVGFIGRREKYKGAEILTEAIRGKKDVEVLLYGDDFSEIASDNIFNAGRFSRTGLPKILSELDLLVVPSVCFETFSFSTLEALMAGVPVLVSTRVGAKDLLRGAPVSPIFEPEPKDFKRCFDEVMEEDNFDKYTEWVAGLKFTTMNEHAMKVKEAYGRI